MQNTLEQSIQRFISKRQSKVSRNTSQLLAILLQHPDGLKSKQIAIFLRGAVNSSLSSQILLEARVAATRKQIQRAKHFLNQHNSCFRLYYCKKSGVWQMRKNEMAS